MDGQWNAEIITPESEGSTPIATNGGLEKNGNDELKVKVDGTSIGIGASGELEAIDMVQSTDHSVNDVVVVQSLPVSPESNTLYLIPEA